MKDVFSDIYHKNFWKSDQSVSGTGSELAATEIIRKQLPLVFAQMGIRSVLDLPCGDYFWGRFMVWPPYTGADIVREIIEDNRRRFPGLNWIVLDAMTDILPQVDLILCRDMLGHFSRQDVIRTLRNFRRSGSEYLLATTFPDHENGNNDITTGEWRPINMADWRFGLGAPILLINEGCVEGNGDFKDKSLGLWRLN